MSSKKTFLKVKNLNVRYKSGQDTIYAVNGVTFNLEEGMAIGLVGETGAGKTSVAKAIMRILPKHSTKEVSGEVIFEGTDLLKLPEAEMRERRGSSISMIFQDPMTALNPVMPVVEQIAEGIKKHQKTDRATAIKAAIQMLERVGISEDRAYEYPHQFSGGMKQRVVIAIALVCNPKLLIADEPTTALDVTIQAQVLELISSLKEKNNTSMILITHDLGVVAETCDTVAVIYAGDVVEYAEKVELFDHPAHPYTVGLFGALPDMSIGARRLSPIDGMPPDPSQKLEGCAFYERCPRAAEACRHGKIGMTEIAPGHQVRCINYKEEV